MPTNVQTNISFTNCVLIENDLYFYASNLQALCKMSLNTMCVSFLTELIVNGEKISSIGKIFHDKNKIYMLSSDGQYYISYSIKTMEYKSIKIFCNQRDNLNYEVANFNEYLYIFPKYKKNIVRIDKKNHYAEELENGIYDENSIYEQEEFFSFGFQSEDEMWLLSTKPGYIIRFFFTSREYSIYHLPGLTQKCVHASLFKDCMYLLGECGKIFKWMIGDKDVIEIIDINTPPLEYWRMAIFKKRIFLLPAKGKQILQIEDKNIKYVKYPADFGYSYEGGTKYNGYAEDTHKIYFAAPYGNYMLVIDKKEMEPRWLKMTVPAKLLIKQAGIAHENTQTGLAQYLQYIVEENEYRKKRCKRNIGTDIWSICRE